jgi:hypothetical protein
MRRHFRCGHGMTLMGIVCGMSFVHAMLKMTVHLMLGMVM